jgi:hypothetical protein
MVIDFYFFRKIPLSAKFLGGSLNIPSSQGNFTGGLATNHLLVHQGPPSTHATKLDLPNDKSFHNAAG